MYKYDPVYNLQLFDLLYKPRNIINDIKFRRYIRRDRKVLTNTGGLKAMAEALVFFERAFSYDNQNSPLHTDNHGKSFKMSPKEMFYTDDDFEVTITFSPDNPANIYVKYKKGYHWDVNFRFYSHEYQKYLIDPEDRMLYLLIMDRISRTYYDLLKYYYYHGPQRAMSKTFFKYHSRPMS